MTNFYRANTVPPTADTATIEDNPLVIDQQHAQPYFKPAFTAKQCYFVARYCIAVFLAVATLASCNHEPIAPPAHTTTTQSMPLRIGNWWKYVSPDCPDTSAYILQEVVDYKLVGSHYYYVMKTTILNDTIFYEGIYRTDTSYWRYEGSRLLSGPILDDTVGVREDELFNESYTIVPYDSIYREYGFSVLRDTVSITVPAGTFSNCIEVVSNSRYPDGHGKMYLAQGIGSISESWFRAKLELKEYHIVP